MDVAKREQLRAAWRASGVYADVTVAELLGRGAEWHPDDTIVFATSDGAADVATLSRLHDGARRLAARLVAAGVGPGEVVVVQGPADRAGTELVEALWLLGTVVMPVPTAFGPSELGHVITESGASTFVAPADWRGVDLVGRVVEHAREWGLQRVLASGSDAPPGARPLDSLPDDGLLPSARPSPAEVCCILYTSGSTAAPKGVQHSHETLLAGIAAVPVDAAMRTLAAFPAGHVASLLGLLRPLLVGGTTVVLDRWSAWAATALVEEHRVTNSSGTPFFLSTMLDEADRTGRDVSSLRLFLVGAATVPPALVARAEARGIISWRTYGSTEHPAITTGTPTDPPEKRRCTDGCPGAGNEVRLVDEHGNDVDPGAEGEIVARGPKQFLGYRDASLDGESFLGSWFRTGDLGRFDADGYLVVTDRIKDVIIRGGENISAREIEHALAGHPAVEEVAVCAGPDELWGERVCAFVRAAPGTAPTRDELAAHLLAAGVAARKAPAEVTLVDDFPRTAAGKIKKGELRRARVGAREA